MDNPYYKPLKGTINHYTGVPCIVIIQNPDTFTAKGSTIVMTVVRELQENPQGWDCAVATLYPSRHIANHFMDHILMELVNCIFWRFW